MLYTKQMKFCLILSIINIYGLYVAASSLYSSQESVTVTCTVNGTTLRWEAQEGDNDPIQIESFEQDRRVGSGFSRQKQFNCRGWITFTGALEIPNPRVNLSIQQRQSSMIVTPISKNVSSHCAPLTIICKSLDAGAKPNTITYQSGGKSL